jgi:peptide/nickel transport system substrate-binding protein
MRFKIRMKKNLLILVLLFVVFTFSGCRDRADDDMALKVALESAPVNLDPRIGTDLASARVHQLVFNPLVTTDIHSEIIPELADRVDLAGDRTYIFHLRPGVRFHDGHQLTSADVRYTFESLLSPDFISVKKHHFKIVERIETPDEYTVRFILKQPFSSFLINIAGVGIIPAGAGDDFALHPIGTGPFKLLSYREDEELRFARFDDYFEGMPKLNGLVLKIIPDATTRMLALEKGEIDLLINALPPDMVAVLAGKPGLKLITAPGCNYTYLGFNFRDELVKKKAVRQAIAYAIDRDRIIEAILGGLAEKANGILAEGNWAYEGEVVQYNYDPARAMRLLDEAGFPDPDGEGEAYRLTLTLKISNNKLSRDLATVFAADLAKVGIRLNIRSYEWQTFYSDIIKGNFQVYLLRFVGATDPDIYRYCFHSSSIPPNGANRGAYLNPKLDRLIDEAKGTLERESIKRLYSEIQRIVAEELPLISLWHNTNFALMGKDVDGLVLYPNASFKYLKDVIKE